MVIWPLHEGGATAYHEHSVHGRRHQEKACGLLVVNCQAWLSSAMEATALSFIGQEAFRSPVTGWLVWQWLAWTHGHTTWVMSTAGHRAVTTWTACQTTAFGPPLWSLAQMRTVLVWDADGWHTCDGLMTAVPSRCCPECVSLCQQRTSRTLRLVAHSERRPKRPCGCSATVSVPFARWHEYRWPLSQVLTWCNRLVT